MSLESKEFQVAGLVAEEAGNKVLPYFGRTLVAKEHETSPTDVYSEADKRADKVIFNRLTSEFPEFNYLSEEQEFIDRGSDFTWVVVVDPLDGSAAFLAGLDYWGISIGFQPSGLISFEPSLF